jgi:RimJ/RimL family protein N-acetyltransferase
LTQVILLSGQPLILRPATSQDAEKTILYVQQVAGETDHLLLQPGEFQPTIEEQKKVIENFAQSETHLYLIAEIDDEITGILTFQTGRRVRNAHVGEFGISVQKKFWGLSIGRQMLLYLMTWARETGKIRKINLKVRVDNERAIRLYRSLGFQIEGTISREFWVNGQFFSCHLMGIKID